MSIDPVSGSWYEDENSVMVWKYGTELWCNMQGRYTHIVADLSLVQAPFTMSICQFGVFGTKYARNEEISETVIVQVG